MPSLTTSTAVVLALEALGARRVALVTPYIAAVSAGARAYLAEAGVEVVAQRDLDLLSNLEKGRLGPEASYRLSAGMNLDGVDAVFVSCTNWRTREALVALEADRGVPAISSNIATLWALLHLAGVSTAGIVALTLFERAPLRIPDFVLP